MPTTEAPTDKPTAAPTDPPTDIPTAAPTGAPTDKPTAAPTDPPTDQPTAAPTDPPTDQPTAAPTDPPTDIPTAAPTGAPTIPFQENGQCCIMATRQYEISRIDGPDEAANVKQCALQCTASGCTAFEVKRHMWNGNVLWTSCYQHTSKFVRAQSGNRAPAFGGCARKREQLTRNTVPPRRSHSVPATRLRGLTPPEIFFWFLGGRFSNPHSN